ncbi:MAG: SusD/RagB family nutrient-binding outer membrane lipoprotein [Daejeonella sp.]|uniref:SusD/RagB family nutrient-binding outer membrane lipoprotein n=1 Tax=Daejeonella sp. JGW-45 TaxID=3034148 RepID=UPI0023EBBB5A|nr:SusD/RagB family nutrient-binding outer membrane lipoprotein [Daejeonella sp. JGW-45]
MENFTIKFGIRKFACLILMVCILSPGCTDDFEEINTKPSGLKTLDPSDVRSLFPSAQYNVFTERTGYNWQTMTMLFAGMYSQHFAGVQPAQESHRYVIVQRWMDIWPATYTNVMSNLQSIIENTDSKEPTLNAIARIWKVVTLQRLTDYFGPIPYSQIGTKERSIRYDAQKDIYYDFFKELDEATVLLKNNMARVSFADKDLLYQGDNAKWLRFANSLRLRLAIRISNVEPAKAKEEAEKAFAGGVMMAVGDGAYIKSSSDFPHGLNAHIARNNSRMSATMESIQKGYNDPRMQVYWSPAPSDGQYRGIRNGMTVADQNLPVHSRTNLSNVGLKYSPSTANTTPMVCMYASEVYFLRAEGALNGWNMGGNAKDLYEKGIETSMNEHGITNSATISTYTNGTTGASALNDMYKSPPVTTVPVKFSADVKIQREQIGTQKWLALFPEPHEAWAEIRRSGYPRFYPLLNSQNPDIAPDKMIRRISFLDREIIANGEAVKAAVPLLGGPDNVATPLWWDKNPK